MRPRFANLPRRIYLTFKYEGLAGIARRSARFMALLTPFARFLDTTPLSAYRSRARRWCRAQGRHVTVVIPTHGDAAQTIRAVRSVRRTTKRRPVRIIVVDDGSGAGVQERLRTELAGDAELVAGEQNVGFAGNVNRVLEPLARESLGDVVLLNNDVVAHRGWLDCLQYAAHREPGADVVGPLLLYPDGRIQSAGSYRNLGAPEWFDHRYRFKAADHRPATVPAHCVGITGACMYVTRETLAELGALDSAYAMAFEDMDYSLRAWNAGRRVLFHPAAVLTHAESISRGTVQGPRELGAQEHFWATWGAWFDRRKVRRVDGRLRIIYVTQDTGMGGGHREVFEHVSRLAARGHDVALHTLDGSPDWFDLDVPVRTFVDYDELADDLARRDGFKVATWWQTAAPVWLGSVGRGIPVYFVQDIETSYYPEDQRSRDRVMASYREEFHYMTTSGWNQERLAELGLEAARMPCGVDRRTFRPLEGVGRRKDVLLAAGRSHALKNLELTIAAWRRMPEPRPELWLYGAEPELGEKYGARYFERPSDAELNELLNEATAFVQTSRHEGFCLPALEAMAAGTPVIATDAHGNRDYCVDGENCLMPGAAPDAVAAALNRTFREEALGDQLAAGGRATAAAYDRSSSGERLERFFTRIADRRGAPQRAVPRPLGVQISAEATAVARSARDRARRHGTPA